MQDEKVGYRDVSADELRVLMQSRGESGYELIDVRERDEYEGRHLPGARLIPLSELEGRVGEVRADRHTVFYCGSGKRSARAATFVAEARTLPELYSLDGGLAAWDGETLPSFPKLHVFDSTGTVDQIVMRAMDLEKGAERLYGALMHAFEGSSVQGSLRKLLHAEEGHAKLLFGLLPQEAGAASRSFDELYGAMTGDLLENGETFEHTAARIRSVPSEKRYLLLELALDMEFQAFDLYRNLAALHPGTDLEDTLLKLAAQEKLHFRMVLDALGLLAAENRDASPDPGRSAGRRE
jgi:rhodanese-related sulfurtransferase/rubrerythrin